ncbi:MAG TPA: DUF2059 domain-containing protein [Flavobacterium sp.]|jgi:hypothetical protein
MKKLLFTIVFISVANFSFAQDEAFKKEVLKVIELNGSMAQMQLAKEQIVKSIAPEKQGAFVIEFDASMPALYDKIAKVYMETYTKEDIKSMLAFYDSPVGKKITASAATIAQKSMTAGQEWGQGLQAMIMKYVQ